MHRLEQTGSGAERGRWQQAERAGEDRRFVAENVAEHVFGQHHVERCRISNQSHGGRIDVAVLEPHVGVIARELRDGFAPQLRDLEHIRLVYGRDEPPPASSGLERHACDALDLGRRVRQRVDRAHLFAPARLTVVETTGQLAHDQQIDALQTVGFQRRAVAQRGVDGDWPQIRKHPQQLAQRQQARFRTQRAGRRVQSGITHGAKQHRVALNDDVARRRWQRIVGRGDASCADRQLRELEPDREALTHRFEHAHRLGDHLRPDAVARQYGNGECLHGLTP